MNVRRPAAGTFSGTQSQKIWEAWLRARSPEERRLLVQQFTKNWAQVRPLIAYHVVRPNRGPALELCQLLPPELAVTLLPELVDAGLSEAHMRQCWEVIESLKEHISDEALERSVRPLIENEGEFAFLQLISRVWYLSKPLFLKLATEALNSDDLSMAK